MKKRIKKRICALTAVCLACMILSGFTDSGNYDSPDEIHVARLVEERARIMERAFFETSKPAKLFSDISKIETHPLLKADMNSFTEYTDSDADRVINAKVTMCRTISRKVVVHFYEVAVKWYMSGYDGYYVSEQTYKLRVLANDDGLKISDMTLQD